MALKSFISRTFISFSKLQQNYNLLYCNISQKRLFTTGKQNKRSTLKLSLIGASVGALVGTGYSLSKLNQPNTHITNEEISIPVINNAPKIQPSRKIYIPNDTTGLKLTLYQYQTCPFCCKVRAFLDYYGISYDVIEVDPVLRQSVKWSQYKKVPILLAEVEGGHQQLNDSSMIISALSSYLVDNTKKVNELVQYYPILLYTESDGTIKNEIMNKYFLMLDGAMSNKRTSEEITEERKWRKWADEVLVHTLSPNVYRSHEEALQAFNWFSNVGGWEQHFPAWERMIIIYVGAFAMWLIGKKLKTKYHLKDDVRQSLYDECNYWMNAIKRKHTLFMGGNTPNLSDLAVYGVLNSIEGCWAFQDLMDHSKISIWYEAMKNAVQNHEGMKYINS